MRTNAIDIRGALRLANELHDLADDTLLRRRHLVSGLCALIGADVGLSLIRNSNGSTTTTRATTNGRATVTSVGFDSTDHQRAVERHFREHPEPSPLFGPTIRASVRNGWAVTTQRRLDLFAKEDVWAALPMVNQFRQEWGLYECMASIFPLGRAGRAAWIFLYRKPREPFTPRECDLLHVIHGELDWMYRPNRPSGPIEFRTLTIRQRQTLYRLLAGDSEKQVAAGLGLSRHTVHVHVKSLYRTFKVNSRNELLAKFVRPMEK